MRYASMLDLEFKLKPSRQCVAFLSLLLLATVAIMLWLPMLIWLKIIGLMFIIPYGAHGVWQVGLLRSQAILSLRRGSDGSWLVYTPSQIYQGELSGESTVSGMVSVLRF